MSVDGTIETELLVYMLVDIKNSAALIAMKER